MNCIRCKNSFDDYTPYRNAECYGDVVYYACPHCGKLYRFMRKVEVSEAEFCTEIHKVDDWGHKVVSDEKYYKRQTDKTD